MLAPRGIAAVDAPVSGGVKGAAAGTLTLMVSGPASRRATRASRCSQMFGKVSSWARNPASARR